MRLYFTDDTRKIGIDTKAEVWTNENDADFMRDNAHRFLRVSPADLDRVMAEIDFNDYGYSRELLPLNVDDLEPAELPFC